MNNSIRGKVLTKSEIENLWLARLKSITEKHPFINVSWIPLVLYPLIGLQTHFDPKIFWGVLAIWAICITFSIMTYSVWLRWHRSKGNDHQTRQSKAIQMMLGWTMVQLMEFSILLGWSGIVAIIGDNDVAEKSQFLLPSLIASIALIMITVAVFGSRFSRTLHPEMFPPPDEGGQVGVSSALRMTYILVIVFIGAASPIAWFGPNSNPIEKVYGGLLLGIAFLIFFETMSRLYQLAILILGKDPFRDAAM